MKVDELAVNPLIHPSDNLFSLLERMTTQDITTDVTAMQLLQREVPVLFSLLRSLKGRHINLLSPIIKTMAEKSLAPFVVTDVDVGDVSRPTSQLAFFPNLPCVRMRGNYVADKANKIDKLCTKQSLGHPSLLPGLFTVYCEHGL